MNDYGIHAVAVDWARQYQAAHGGCGDDELAEAAFADGLEETEIAAALEILADEARRVPPVRLSGGEKPQKFAASPGEKTPAAV